MSKRDLWVITEQDERVVRHIPAPEWRTGEPEWPEGGLFVQWQDEPWGNRWCYFGRDGVSTRSCDAFRGAQEAKALASVRYADSFTDALRAAAEKAGVIETVKGWFANA